MLTNEERADLIERLTDNVIENLTHFVLNGDVQSLREYVTSAESFDELNDGELQGLAAEFLQDQA